MRALVGPSQIQSQDPLSAAQGDETQIDLRAMLGVLQRHRWLIAATVVCILAVALIVSLQVRKQYTATTLVVIDNRDSQKLGFEPGMSDNIAANSGMVDTEVEIARSAKVGERAAIALAIASWPEFRETASTGDMLRSMVGMGGAQTAGSEAAAFPDLSETEKARLVSDLIDRVQIRRIGLTSVISMSATAYEPDTAAKIANAFADAYLTEQIVAKVGSNERTAAFLRARVEGLAKDISTLETQIDAFVMSTLAQLGTPEAKQLLLDLSAESRQRQANTDLVAEIQEALRGNDYPRLVELSNLQDADMAARRKALIDQLAGANDPARLKEARANLESLDTEIRTAAERRTSALQADLSSSSSRSAEMRQQVESTLTELQLPKDVSVELFRLQRDAETTRTLYDSFLTKLRQVEQETDFTIPDSRVIASASPPNVASFPPIKLILAGALLFSFCGGIGLAFLREHFIGGITSTEQLENLIALPVVAAVPRYAGGGDSDQADKAIIAEPLSAFSESIRRIRLGIETYGPKGKKSIFVTSSLPADGKTTIAISLARHFATTGSSTLLIDADLRHPSVHRLLNEKVEHGLIDFLAQGASATPDQLTMVTEAASGAHFILGADASAIATDALLMSSRFDDLMKYAREHYDIVIVDTPPVGLVVDATIAARQCDLGLFIVRYASTSQHAVRASMRDLTRRVDLPLCAVLNQVESADSYRYGYGRKYQRYYR